SNSEPTVTLAQAKAVKHREGAGWRHAIDGPRSTRRTRAVRRAVQVAIASRGYPAPWKAAVGGSSKCMNNAVSAAGGHSENYAIAICAVIRRGAVEGTVGAAR